MSIPERSSDCAIGGCTKPPTALDMCTAHAVLFAHLVDGDLAPTDEEAIREFDRLAALPIPALREELNRRFGG